MSQAPALLGVLTDPLKINGNLTLPMRIWAVRVEGAPLTRTSFLSSIINPLLSPNFPFSRNELAPSLEGVPRARTLESVLHTTRRITDVFMRSDIFASVQPSLQRSRDPLAQTEDIDLVLRCREHGRFFLKTATEIGNNEGTAVRSMTCRSNLSFQLTASAERHGPSAQHIRWRRKP